MTKTKINKKIIDNYFKDQNISLKAKLLLTTITGIFMEERKNELDSEYLNQKILDKIDKLIKEIYDNKYLVLKEK